MPKSDIDLRLVDKGNIVGFFELSGFQLDLQERLGISVDVLPTDSLSQSFLDGIVKSIFDYKINGYNEGQIAELLDSRGILSPSEYKKTSGIAYHTPFALKDKALWSVNAIKRIIKNHVYIGHLEQEMSGLS